MEIRRNPSSFPLFPAPRALLTARDLEYLVKC